MKYAILLPLFMIMVITGFSQMGVKEIAKADADQIENKVNKGVNFGISLGFNSVFRKLYDARISPLDGKLKITEVPRMAFLISTGLSVPLTGASSKSKSTKYYRKTVDNAEVGPVYFVPNGLCFVATVNLVTFNSSASGSIFNQKIDGGLGLGYRVNSDFQLAATFEMISYRQPRDFLLAEYKNTVLKNGAGDAITSISPDNNDYFHDRYMPSLSIKFFYLLGYKPVK